VLISSSHVISTPVHYDALLVLLLLNVKINVALSENASRTRYAIKIELKLRKWVLEKKSLYYVRVTQVYAGPDLTGGRPGAQFT